MTNAFLNQASMAAGEVGPHLYGRVDQELYYIGMRTVRNFIIRQYGGASNRPGTYFTAEARDGTHKVRVIPFSFNEEQTYIIQLGHQYMRLIVDNGEITETNKVITAITQANPAVVTSAAHGLSNGDDVYISGVIGMTNLNGRTVRIKNVTANTFELTDYQGNNINSTSYGAYVGGGTAARIYTVATPWTEDALFDIDFSQKNDVITLCHPDYPVRDITRTGNTAWTVTIFPSVLGPFKDKNTGATTVTASAVSGAGVTLTASTPIFDATMVGDIFYLQQMPTDATKTWEVGKVIAINDIRRAGFNYYQALNNATTGTQRPDHVEGSATDGDNGVQWQYLHSGFGIAQITAFTDTTHVTATINSRLPDNILSTPTSIWAKAAWSVAEGYPSTCAYHKQRFVLGGTNQQPSTLWMSGVALRTNFGQSNPIFDDEAITIPLDTTEVNAIRHLLPLKSLVVLTSSSEQAITGNQDGSILASSPPTASVEGYTGSSKVKPIIIQNTALFVQDMGSLTRSLQFQLADDGFSGIDLSARSPHLFEDKEIVDWSYQRHPLSVVWAVMSDGALNGFTFMQEQKVYAWHRHDTDGTYESVASVREGNESATYLVIRRTINGVQRRFIERFASRTKRADVRDYFFVDAGLSYDGRNTTATTITITGGTTWDTPEVLTLSASSAIFFPTDVGNEIAFWYIDPDGNTVRLVLSINGYTSGTVVSAVPTKALPLEYQNTARTDWEFARKNFKNFNHLEAKSVVAFADGNVVKDLTVTGGEVTLPDCAGVVHIGLGFVSDLETLDMSQPQGQTKAKTLNVPRAFLTVQETRTVFAATNAFPADDDEELGSDTSKFVEYKPRDPDTGYDLPIPAGTDLFEIGLNSEWSNKGRFCIRNNDPTPITINCITPDVVLGYS